MNNRIRPVFGRGIGFGGGGFLGPFILGGITGSLITPLFYQRPYPYYYQPYPYYRPYYY